MLDKLDPLLAPLARLLVAKRVAFPDLVERMKAHYLEAAKALTPEKTTDSRLSIMTGLQRRDIARLRNFSPKDPKPNHQARLVALWQTEDGYQKNGVPLELSKAGDAPSFEALARIVRRDVHPRTVLDALTLAGTVMIDPVARTVKLVATSYQPLPGSEAQLDYLAKNVGDHLAAAGDNVQGLQPPFFERAVHYENLTELQIGELNLAYQKGQMALFESLSQKAAAMKKQSGDDAQHRFRAGGYFFHMRGGKK